MNTDHPNARKTGRHRVRTPSQRTESARVARPPEVLGSSLKYAVSDGIADFWRDLSSANNQSADSTQADEAFGDVIAEMLLHLYEPQELLFEAFDERLFQSDDLRWYQRLTGDETSINLARAFASVAGLRLDQVDHGFRGNRVAILKEFFHNAERYRYQPDLIVALVKGLLVLTLTSQPALASSNAFGCDAVSGILDHAWSIVDVRSRTTRQFLSELAHFLCLGLGKEDWQDLIEIAHRVIELMERLDDESGKTAADLAVLWHRMLQSLVNQAQAKPQSIDRVWLHWYSWVAQGYASQLQKINADVANLENVPLTQLVDRLSEYAVIASMRSITRPTTAISPRPTVVVLLQDISDEEAERSWIESPHHYQQLCEAILVTSPCWEARFHLSRTPEAYLRRAFHCGLAAIVALIIEDDAQDHVLRWFDVAETIKDFRHHADSTTQTTTVIGTPRFNNLLMVEEVFMWWLALGVAFNATQYEYVVPCLKKIWNLLEYLLTGRRGYSIEQQPMGLGTIREQTLIWLDRYLPQNQANSDQVASIRESIINLTGPLTVPGGAKLNLSDEFQRTFVGLVNVLGAERNATPLISPTITRNDGAAARGFAPAVAVYWQNIFQNLGTSLDGLLDGSLNWGPLLKPLLRDIAALHQLAESPVLLPLTNVFQGQSSHTELVSQGEQTLVDLQEDSNWELAGAPIEGWAPNPASTPRTMIEWLQQVDYTFLSEPATNSPE